MGPDSRAGAEDGEIVGRFGVDAALGECVEEIRVGMLVTVPFRTQFSAVAGEIRDETEG